MDTAHNTAQEAVTKTIPEKKECKTAKWLSEEALQMAEQRREAKAREKGNDIPNKCRVPETSKEREERLLQDRTLLSH